MSTTLRRPRTEEVAAHSDTEPIKYRATYRKIAIVVGILFLTSTATFVAGSRLITSYFSAGSSEDSTLLTGVLLEGYTGLAVAAIGILMLGILRNQSARLARAYLVLRILECLSIIAIGAYFLTSNNDFADYELAIYAFTGSGGVILAYLLYVSGLIPRWLSGLGLIGYPMLLAGIPAALFASADLNSGWGTLFFVPGGVFELLLPVVLFIRGFAVGAPPLTRQLDERRYQPA